MARRNLKQHRAVAEQEKESFIQARAEAERVRKLRVEAGQETMTISMGGRAVELAHEAGAKRAKNFPRAKRIYGHARAGRRAYQLFERLAEYSGEYDGRVNMSRTLKRDKPATSRVKEYPPVYTITYAPTIWTYATRDMMEPLFKIGDEFGCRVHLAVREKVAVVEFRDGGLNFKGN